MPGRAPGSRRLLLGTALATVIVLSTGGCGGTTEASDGPVTVYAAASLTEAFGDVAKEFHRDHNDAPVEFNFGSSATLVTQLSHGAQADVFASADEVNMTKAVDAKLVDGTPQTFAHNRLTILVAPGNPRGITGLRDLVRPGLSVALAAPQVPAGRYAQEAFRKAGVRAPASSQELDVKTVVSRVALGEVDAGVAYVTDVKPAARKVEAVEIPAEHNVTANYQVAVLREAHQGGELFLKFLLSDAGRAILERHGFEAP